MPLYEYLCQQCGRHTEKIQKFSDPELTVCPHCGGRLERTLTAPAVQFKGSGWYKDLYSSPKPAAASTEKSSASAGEGSSAKAGESSAPATGSSDSPAPSAAASTPPTSPASKS